jgi:hypothetical protein
VRLRGLRAVSPSRRRTRLRPSLAHTDMARARSGPTELPRGRRGPRPHRHHERLRKRRGVAFFVPGTRAPPLRSRAAGPRRRDLREGHAPVDLAVQRLDRRTRHIRRGYDAVRPWTTMLGKPAPAKVGTSGSAGERCAAATASAPARLAWCSTISPIVVSCRLAGRRGCVLIIDATRGLSTLRAPRDAICRLVLFPTATRVRPGKDAPSSAGRRIRVHKPGAAARAPSAGSR